MSTRLLAAALLLWVLAPLSAETSEKVAAPVPWSADRDDGTYVNPVLNADYSDPDAVREGGDYYLTSSSFNHIPGLPILHSKDLVNWSLINHALPRRTVAAGNSEPDHGNGVWAPSIRFHDGRYWIFWGDPDQGVFHVTATDPGGKWSEPHLVIPGKGLIDACPLWDEDGRVWLVHGWAKSRAGFNNILTLRELKPDASAALEGNEGITIINGDKLPDYRTLEGPKFYKRDGWYWIFAPAGGVTEGWQSVFRSRKIEGPYEDRIVLDQGKTDVNGPHQGAWVTTPGGQDWFLHFQDRGPMGRVVHLQPMKWSEDGWPVIGTDPDVDGRGEPVRQHAKPDLPASPPAAPPATDLFTSTTPGLQWQWQGNPADDWLVLPSDGTAHLRAVPRPESARSLWDAVALWLQKPPADEFTATTTLTLPADTSPGTEAGLLVLGQDYAWLGLVRTKDGCEIVRADVRDARKGSTEKRIKVGSWPAGKPLELRLTWSEAGKRCSFAWRDPAKGEYVEAGEAFATSEGRWVGAKFGIFAQSTAKTKPTDEAVFTTMKVER